MGVGGVGEEELVDYYGDGNGMEQGVRRHESAWFTFTNVFFLHKLLAVSLASNGFYSTPPIRDFLLTSNPPNK